MAHVISASRRTDIPAFYSEWFINRIREGHVRWMNPFSNAVYRVSLRPEDVSAIVFWSKDYRPLLPHLDELDALGFRMLFHFTITGLPRVFEPRVPDAAETVRCARYLSSRYGADAVLWRYDPVLVSDVTDARYHMNRFRDLCAALEGSVKRCYFSFPAFYAKVRRNASALQARTGIAIHDLPMAERVEMANALAEVAAQYGIEMFSCCGDYLVQGTIKRAHCIDGELLHRLYPDRVGRLREVPSRPGCGCCESTDIGAYDTCAHACVYCYANAEPRTSLRICERNNPHSDILGTPRGHADARRSSVQTESGGRRMRRDV